MKKQFFKSLFKRLNIGITTAENLQRLTDNNRIVADLELLLELNAVSYDAPRLLGALRGSQAQLRQDLFVLAQLRFKRDGFFVEFGATNGVTFSNTYLLEKDFGWHGILAEPAIRWHDELRRNRTAKIETRCVWSGSHTTLRFNEAADGQYSAVDSFGDSDYHPAKRQKVRSYEVNTISLLDLLNEYNAPATIDYLSIDTEGSEYEILSNFDFQKFNINVITCEHNFTPAREKIQSLLARNGYIRKFDKFSQYDDWYVHVDVLRLP